MRTPWGESDAVERAQREGVVWVSTPSHGGVRVSVGLMPALSEQAVSIGEWDYGALWFEEDCAWAAAAYEHPEWFVGLWPGQSAEGIKQQASETLRRWYPEYRQED